MYCTASCRVLPPLREEERQLLLTKAHMHTLSELVNWVNIRTKMSVDGLSVRIFTQIFRG